LTFANIAHFCRPANCTRGNALHTSSRASPQARWPEARVHLFGSTASRLNLRHSNDLDVSLELLPEPEDKVSLTLDCANLQRL